VTGSRKPRDAGELPAEELAALARSGDRASFEALVVRYRPRLVAFLARRVASTADAEDVAQETFVRAHDHLDRYDPSRPFGTWLFTIGKNVAANHATAGARRAARERASGAEPAPSQASDASEAADLWQRAARILPPDTYRMLWLRYARSYSVGEIAAEMNRSSVAIKVMLFRARRRLLEEVR
jgi:RNA polymerase sigma-70 factor (ECF subfamily)